MNVWMLKELQWTVTLTLGYFSRHYGKLANVILLIYYYNVTICFMLANLVSL